MAHYAIGDIQGCFDEFRHLLEVIAFNPGTDTLWLTGDLVNRGPKSLETLRFIREHDGSMQTVLGNHDLHLLALAHGVGKPKRSDTLNDILNAPDKNILLDWLGEQPLLRHLGSDVLVHAGLWPQWTVTAAAELAVEAEAEIRRGRSAFFREMYGNKPKQWIPELTGSDRLRFILNAFTRMRAVTVSGKTDFDYKSTLAQMPYGLLPWFRSPGRKNTDARIIFGHWSALGLYRGENVLGLDTGALWGGTLTAADLKSGETCSVAGFQGLNWENAE